MPLSSRCVLTNMRERRDDHGKGIYKENNQQGGKTAKQEAEGTRWRHFRNRGVRHPEWRREFRCIR